MKLFYDLHIHSCLSPCGDPDMTPNNIAGMAYVKGLNIIALTDHNTSRNAGAVQEAAKQYGIIVIPGMELTTAEEVHVLCLFPDTDKALRFDALVYERLIKVKNKPAFFGTQVMMDAEDNPVGEEEYLLINATDITFDESFGLVNEYGGLMIPAHLEKETTSLLSNLGMIPPDAVFPCAEINHPEQTAGLVEDHPYLRGCRIIHDSDAHMLGAIAEPLHTLDFPNASPAPAEILAQLRVRTTDDNPVFL